MPMPHPIICAWLGRASTRRIVVSMPTAPAKSAAFMRSSSDGVATSVVIRKPGARRKSLLILMSEPRVAAQPLIDGTALLVADASRAAVTSLACSAPSDEALVDPTSLTGKDDLAPLAAIDHF